MKEKDELKRKMMLLSELLKNYNKEIDTKNSNDSFKETDTNVSNKNVSSKSLSKSLGAHPGIGKSIGYTNDDYPKTGYSSALMLSVIVFIFQVLFMFISYLIFKP